MRQRSILFVGFGLVGVQAFVPVGNLQPKASNKCKLYSIFDDDKPESSNEFEGFNPFNRKETIAQRRAPQVLGSSTISVRKMRMKEVMSNLLSADESDYERILLENEDLIMEPLLEDDAVMDEDSIYELGMTREERFERYELTMMDREAKAVNKSVQKILSSMRLFVMSRKP